ncbi:hypothetical protein SKAU_G00239990 [Synaphobranchus kaupii]|uniref:Syntaxin binding protein 5 n=1 Tax=Synaphobranchus kaupii TaxID=118154 RepID=A0A9Q1IS48_SYNKA|nr:hypothetical protein SKAU_G00239990 [Synaphobranchus kaupii]
MKKFRKVLDGLTTSSPGNTGGAPLSSSTAGTPTAVPTPREIEVQETLVSENFHICKTVRHGFPYQPTALAFDPVQKILAIGSRTGGVRMYPFPPAYFLFVGVSFHSFILCLTGHLPKPRGGEKAWSRAEPHPHVLSPREAGSCAPNALDVSGREVTDQERWACVVGSGTKAFALAAYRALRLPRPLARRDV